MIIFPVTAFAAETKSLSLPPSFREPTFGQPRYVRASVDGSRVVSRWTVTGFNRGMFGAPADDRPVQFTGIAIWEVRNGKLAYLKANLGD